MSTMEKDLEFMIAQASESLLEIVRDTDEPDLYLSLERESVPIWEQLSTDRKIECIKYVRENPEDEDFGHSQCCSPIHQATAYFLVQWYREQDSEVFFDDLDFMMFQITPESLATGECMNYERTPTDSNIW